MRTESDIALTALAVEAERRRRERGLIRYNYGDLIAEITPEEREQIIENYKKRLRRGGASVVWEKTGEESNRKRKKTYAKK